MARRLAMFDQVCYVTAGYGAVTRAGVSTAEFSPVPLS